MFLMTETLSDVSLIVEDQDGKKDIYIEGIFLESERKNRNGRIYPKSILEREVESYINKYVKTNRGFGELNHPQSSSINPDRISHLVTEINADGNNFVGKARVLDTPSGKIVKALLEGGGKIGISSRGLGTVKSVKGVNEVQSDYSLRCLDIVTDPSGIECFVEMVMEGEIWVPKAEEIIAVISEADSLQLQQAKLTAFKLFLENC